MLHYGDDFLAFVPGPKCRHRPTLLKQRARVQRLLDHLGLTRAEEKGQWEPTTTIDSHLGLTVSTSNNGGEFSIPPPKRDRIKTFAKDLIRDSRRHRRLCPARHLASFAGLCQSVYLALPCARMFLRSMHDALATKRSWEGNVRLSRQCYRDLEWWSRLPEENIGRPIGTSPTTKTVSSDASGYAWGGILAGKWAHGRFKSAEECHHIMVKELIAAHRTIETFLPELRNHHVRFLEDNQAVVYMVRSRTSKSPVLMGLLRRFYAMLDMASIKISMEYVRSADNDSDAPSRLVDKSDWALAPRVYDLIDSQWGPHTHDCFASVDTSQCATHDSRYRTPHCRTGDTFSQDWETPGRHNFVNPGWQARYQPYALLERVGHLLQLRPRASATVITPYRPGHAFFQTLRRLAVGFSVLDVGPDDFVPAHPQVWLPLSTLHLCVFRILGDRAKRTCPDP